jgi:outer membrane protein W
MKKSIIIILMCAAVITANAQSNSFSLQYSMAFGTGDLANYNAKSSFRGATFEWRKYIDPTIAVGIEVGWNAFYNALPADTYTSGNATLYGKQYRYQNQIPIMAAVNYYFKPDAQVNPFVGLGMGTMYSRRDLDMNVYTFRQDSWSFAVRPEAGILLKMNDATSAYIGLKYYNGFAAGDLNATQSYFALNLGLIFVQ